MVQLSPHEALAEDLLAHFLTRKKKVLLNSQHASRPHHSEVGDDVWGAESEFVHQIKSNQGPGSAQPRSAMHCYCPRSLFHCLEELLDNQKTRSGAVGKVQIKHFDSCLFKDLLVIELFVKSNDELHITLLKKRNISLWIQQVSLVALGTRNRGGKCEHSSLLDPIEVAILYLAEIVVFLVVKGVSVPEVETLHPEEGTEAVLKRKVEERRALGGVSVGQEEDFLFVK